MLSSFITESILNLNYIFVISISKADAETLRWNEWQLQFSKNYLNHHSYQWKKSLAILTAI